ncbi:MAG: hypothetical protein PSU94_10925 [Lacunisphaera sp.]|nr:hypothetical protein [Lacunisphaera sp.]
MKPTPVPPFGSVTALTSLALLLGGCSTSYVVQVDAISQPTTVAETGQPAPPPQSYSIHVTNPRLDESSLRYKEVENYVKTALSGKGMYEAPRPEKADVVIDIDYGIDAPRMKFETISTPIYTEMPGELITTSVPVYNAAGRIVGFNMVTTRGPSRTELLGMAEEIQPVIVYEKYLKVTARSTPQQAGEGRAPAEVWSVNVSAEDNSRELRKYLPILASATADYIGTNTKESKSVKIREGDEAVGFIKKGI